MSLVEGEKGGGGGGPNPLCVLRMEKYKQEILHKKRLAMNEI